MPWSRASCQHQLEHAIGGDAVQVAGGLVGQHAGRPGDQGTGNRHPLAFAAREFGGAVVHAGPADPRGPASSRRAFAASVARITADPQRHGHVVQRSELGQQVVELVDETQVPVAQFGPAAPP
jgi:hypothetical protein